MILKLSSNSNHSRILQEFLAFLLNPALHPSLQVLTPLHLILSFPWKKGRSDAPNWRKRRIFGQNATNLNKQGSFVALSVFGRFLGSSEHSLRLGWKRGRNSLRIPNSLGQGSGSGCCHRMDSGLQTLGNAAIPIFFPFLFVIPGRILEGMVFSGTEHCSDGTLSTA